MASNFPTAYVRVASQTYVLQHISVYGVSVDALFLLTYGGGEREDVDEGVGDAPHVLARGGGHAGRHRLVDLVLEGHDPLPRRALPLQLLQPGRLLPQRVHEVALHLLDAALVLGLVPALQLHEEEGGGQPERGVEEQQHQHLDTGTMLPTELHIVLWTLL